MKHVGETSTLMKLTSATLPWVLKTLALATFAICSALAPARAQEAQEAHPLKPLLWKVEGNGLTQPSYLFATIHIGKAPVGNLHPAAQQAFDSAESLFTEVPMDEASQMAMMPLMMRSDGKTLNDSLGKDLTQQLDEELKLINPQLDAAPFQPLATWAMAVILEMLPVQLEGHKALDLMLWEKATAAGKKTAGMETAQNQIRGLSELTEPEQVIVLDETMKQLRKDREAGKNPIKEIVAAYVTGEPSKVAAEMDQSLREMAKGEHKELGQKIMRRLLTDRDKNMATTISATLKKEPATIHFFAAGAAHFCTDPSILSHLEKDGFKITRIEK